MKKLFLLLILAFSLSQFCYSQENITIEVIEEPKRSSSEEVFGFDSVEEPPEFPGGDEGRLNFLKENIHYPEFAKETGIQGTVFVNFIIEIDGSVSNVKILRGIEGECDEEVIRVVKLMPKWKPGKQKGKNVRVSINLPIKFTLDRRKYRKK